MIKLRWVIILDINKKINYLKKFNKVTTGEMVEATNIPKSTIDKLLSGVTTNPRMDTVRSLARFFNVTLDYFMEDSISVEDVQYRKKTNGINSLTPDQIRAVSVQKIPLLGKVSAGQPILAEEDFECYFEVDADIKCDFCLHVNGDSMINARINDGDIVFIRKQPDVNDGEIGVVLIDNDATLKRVYKNNGSITLVAENTKYKPIVISGKDTIDVRILGKAVAFQSDVK